MRAEGRLLFQLEVDGNAEDAKEHRNDGDHDDLVGHDAARGGGKGSVRTSVCVCVEERE